MVIPLITHSYKRSLVMGSCLLFAALYWLGSQPRLKQFEGKTMGTTYHVSYVDTLFSNSVDTIASAVHATLEDIDGRMSTYRADSELMQFNRSALAKPFTLSSDIVALVKQSQALSELSEGAYDITVGPLVNLWGFGPGDFSSSVSDSTKDATAETPTNIKSPAFIQWIQKNNPVKIPTKEAIQSALDNVGYRYVIADSIHSTLLRTRPVFLDLSSIAKGYAVDQAARTLEHAGITNYMVEVGGEIFVGGKKPDNSPWRLAIRGPELSNSQPRAIVELQDKALATSGNYLNFFEIDGKRYSHTINPLTGGPEANRLAEVAVIHDTTAEADALATLFMVIGDEQGLALANKQNIAAYFTYHDNGGFTSVASEAFKPYLLNQP